jgi:hypothetical protein
MAYPSSLWRSTVTQSERVKYLPIALRIVGAVCIVGIYPLTVLWPSGWAWQTGRSEYLEMIVALYATLGVFLIVAARRPQLHLSIISFTIWSSLVHGTVMAVQAVVNPVHLHHLYGDVLVLLAVAALLSYLAPSALLLRGEAGEGSKGKRE